MDSQSSNERRNKTNSPSKNRTRSYKHVELDRKRPQLSRDSGMNPKGSTSAPSKKRFDKPSRVSDPEALLRIIPLGGLDGIGKNMTVFECNGDMILDDAGFMFPEDEHLGIDLILPDYSYVLEHADSLRGILITHGHEDHIGALPYLLKDLDRDVTIYGTKLTLGLIEGRLNEHSVKNAHLVEIVPGDTIKLGCFTVDFFAVNHSIPGAVGIFLQSPAGNVLHTGDFKLDQTPIDGVTTDFGALARFGTLGVDLLMSDSTNAQNSEFTPSEATVGATLQNIISQAKGRVIIASFASHIHRMQQICDAGIANGRKVVVTGRSMIQNTDIARRLGYLNISEENLIDAYELKDMAPESVVVMCTGSQGEPLSALARIANGDHKTIDIDEGDTVIISASPVPGNEKAVTRVINSLAKIGADVYDKRRSNVHVSGHAGAEELKIMLTLTKPKAFMPVHGESAHLQAHARLAEATGVPKESIFVLDNGDSLELRNGTITRGESVESGVVFVDGLSVGDTSQDVLDERNTLASQGFATIAAAIETQRSSMIKDVQLTMRGITGGDDAQLTSEALERLRDALREGLAQNETPKALRKHLRQALSNLLWERTQQRPMIIVNLLEV